MPPSISSTLQPLSPTPPALYLLSFYKSDGHLGPTDRLRVLISGYLAGSLLVIALTYFFARDISRLLILYFFALEATALILAQYCW